MPHASNPLEIYYPNGFTQAVQMYIWDGLKPVLWDGTVSFSGSIPSTVSGVKSNNAAAPTSDNLGVLPAIANASAPSWTEGRQVLLSTDLSGALRVAATISTAGLATSSKQDTGNTSLASIDTKTPALGQALAAASVPVVLTAAQISTLTPLATVAATQSGTWTVQPGNTPNTAPWLVTHGKTIKSLSGSFTSDTDIIAAVTSKRIKVIAYSFRTFGTSATTILLKSNGTGGTLLWTEVLQSITSTVQGSNLAVPAPSWLFGTAAGEKLTADTNTSDTVYWSLTYFDDDAT
jgi:hypothetical protein